MKKFLLWCCSRLSNQLRGIFLLNQPNESVAAKKILWERFGKAFFLYYNTRIMLADLVKGLISHLVPACRVPFGEIAFLYSGPAGHKDGKSRFEFDLLYWPCTSYQGFENLSRKKIFICNPTWNWSFKNLELSRENWHRSTIHISHTFMIYCKMELYLCRVFQSFCQFWKWLIFKVPHTEWPNCLYTSIDWYLWTKLRVVQL